MATPGSASTPLRSKGADTWAPAQLRCFFGEDARMGKGAGVPGALVSAANARWPAFKGSEKRQDELGIWSSGFHPILPPADICPVQVT